MCIYALNIKKNIYMHAFVVVVVAVVDPWGEFRRWNPPHIVGKFAKYGQQ